MNRLTSFFLGFAALLLLAIGSTILLAPHAFYASDGILLGNDPSLLSEIRAPGGLLATSALLILTGVFRQNLRSIALMLTVLIYGSFGCSRLVSLSLDGIPSTNLLTATVIELVMAAIGLGMLLRLPSIRRSHPSTMSLLSGFTSDRKKVIIPQEMASAHQSLSIR